MDLFGPDIIDKAIEAGIDLDGTQIPEEMLKLYKRVMDKEKKRKRSGVQKSMRNRIVRTGAKHFSAKDLNEFLLKAGWGRFKRKGDQIFL